MFILRRWIEGKIEDTQECIQRVHMLCCCAYVVFVGGGKVQYIRVAKRWVGLNVCHRIVFLITLDLPNAIQQGLSIKVKSEVETKDMKIY